jgi:hypothetical protein
MNFVEIYMASRYFVQDRPNGFRNSMRPAMALNFEREAGRLLQRFRPLSEDEMHALKKKEGELQHL